MKRQKLIRFFFFFFLHLIFGPCRFQASFLRPDPHVVVFLLFCNLTFTFSLSLSFFFVLVNSSEWSDRDDVKCQYFFFFICCGSFCVIHCTICEWTWSGITAGGDSWDWRAADAVGSNISHGHELGRA